MTGISFDMYVVLQSRHTEGCGDTSHVAADGDGAGSGGLGSACGSGEHMAASATGVPGSRVRGHTSASFVTFLDLM